MLKSFNSKHVLCLVFAIVAFILTAPERTVADDGAASVAAGGLVSRRETRVVMAREVLRLGGPKVIVDYDFRNDSDQEVTTEVAFPVPPYKKGHADTEPPDVLAFRTFRLWVGDKPVDYQVQATATLKDKDVTAELEANHIDIASLGHFQDVTNAAGVEHEVSRDFNRLPRDARDKLVHDGLFEQLDNSALAKWTVHLQYHWTQTFPAHATVHIRHQYTPVVGSQNMSLASVQAFSKGKAPDSLDKESEDFYARKVLSGFCLDDSTLRAITGRFTSATPTDGGSQAGSKDNFWLSPHWIDFILTTANTWRQPIEDFTLIIERPKANEDEQKLISFCSPGKVEKVDAEHFRVHLTNFIPKSELHIGFFGIPVAKPARKEPAN